MILVPTWCIFTLSRAIMNQHTNWWFYSLIGWDEILHLGLEPLLITMVSLSNFFVLTFYFFFFFCLVFFDNFDLNNILPSTWLYLPSDNHPSYLVTYSLYLLIYSPILLTYLPIYPPYYIHTYPLIIPTYLPISYLPILLTNLTTNLFTPLAYLSTHLHTYLAFANCHC
jgi:hypothetical protein